MTLNEFIDSLQDIIKKNPEAGNYEVIYSRDDEGNGYQKVYYDPAVCYTDLDEDMMDSIYYDTEQMSVKPNAVCIN